jgi:general secretion pathway protein C
VDDVSIMINFEIESRRRWITALLLVTALLCAGYWMQAGLSAEKTQAATAVPAPVLVVAGTAAELARVLGAPRPALAGAAMSPAERFRVVGVIASTSGQGTALMSIDKQMPRPFAVGANVAPGFVLKAVTPREVRLADSLLGAVTATLPLPDPAKGKTEAPGNDSTAQPRPLQSTQEAEAGPPPLPTIRGAPITP